MSKLTREDLLILMAEEAGEIVQAATKCLRFGYDRVYPGYGANGLVLAKEFGELLAIAKELGLNEQSVEEGISGKIKRATEAKLLQSQIEERAEPATPSSPPGGNEA